MAVVVRESFGECHLAGASSLPLDDLASELYTLPPPGEWPLTLLGSREEIAQAQDLLAPKGWSAPPEGQATVNSDANCCIM